MFEYIQGEKFKELAESNDKIYYSPSHLFDCLDLPKGTSVVITHNSDWSASQVVESNDFLLEFLKSENIKWFTSNCDINLTGVDYVYPLPIGLENNCWQSRDNKIDKISLISHTRSQKEFLMNAIFNVETHPSRSDILDEYIDEDWCISYDSVNGTGFDEYLKILHKSWFTLCPRGNGWDTHRIWETLYCGGNVILEESKFSRNTYYNFPNVLFVTSLKRINRQYLRNLVEQLKTNDGERYVNQYKNYQKLDMEYWRRKILNAI